MSGPLTIGHLRREARKLQAYCRECGREREIVVADAAQLPTVAPASSAANAAPMSAA